MTIIDNKHLNFYKHYRREGKAAIMLATAIAELIEYKVWSGFVVEECAELCVKVCIHKTATIKLLEYAIEMLRDTWIYGDKLHNWYYNGGGKNAIQSISV